MKIKMCLFLIFLSVILSGSASHAYSVLLREVRGGAPGNQSPPHFEAALNALGIPYETASSDEELAEKLEMEWDLVIIHKYDEYLRESVPPLIEYIESGGSLIVSYWGIFLQYYYEDLWAALGVDYCGYFTTPQVIYRWEQTHEVFTFPNSVPNFTTWEDFGYFDASKFNPLPSSTGIAGYTIIPIMCEHGIVLGNDDRTILNGPVLGAYTDDEDGDGIADAQELAENEIIYLLYRIATPTPTPTPFQSPTETPVITETPTPTNTPTVTFTPDPFLMNVWHIPLIPEPTPFDSMRVPAFPGEEDATCAIIVGGNPLYVMTGGKAYYKRTPGDEEWNSGILYYLDEWNSNEYYYFVIPLALPAGTLVEYYFEVYDGLQYMTTYVYGTDNVSLRSREQETAMSDPFSFVISGGVDTPTPAPTETPVATLTPTGVQNTATNSPRPSNTPSSEVPVADAWALGILLLALSVFLMSNRMNLTPIKVKIRRKK